MGKPKKKRAPVRSKAKKKTPTRSKAKAKALPGAQDVVDAGAV